MRDLIFIVIFWGLGYIVGESEGKRKVKISLEPFMTSQAHELAECQEQLTISQFTKQKRRVP